MKPLHSLKMQAIALRKRGMSYGKIQEKVGVSKGTLSYWLKNVPLSTEQRKRLYTARIKNMVFGSQSIHDRREREVSTIIESARKEIAFPLARDAYRLFGAALYWGEGTKAGAFSVTNSDPLLILFMVRWLSKVFDISPKELKAWLNIYPQQNDLHLKRFWSSLTDIPLSRFGKSFVKPVSKGFKKNTLYYGTLKIRVPKSTDLKHRIFGWVQGALGGYTPEVRVIQRRWRRLQSVEKPINLR